MKNAAKDVLIARLDYHIGAIADLLSEKPQSHVIIFTTDGETFNYDVFSYKGPDIPKKIISVCKKTCSDETEKIEEGEK